MAAQTTPILLPASVPTLPVEALETARAYAAESLAPSTRRAYRGAVASFSRWCTAQEVSALPASPAVVAAYLAAEAEDGRSPSTLGQRVAAIRSANNLRGNTIRAGHHLMIPVATKPLSAYSKSADARRAKTQNKQRAANKIEHVVAAGESFWTISQRYKVTTRQLAAWNGMAPRDTLPIGRKLVVWTNADATPRTSPTAALGNTTRKLRYTVRNGDSLYLIANKFRVTIKQIARWNNIDKNKILRPGQMLTMYVDVTRQSS